MYTGTIRAAHRVLTTLVISDGSTAAVEYHVRPEDLYTILRQQGLAEASGLEGLQVTLDQETGELTFDGDTTSYKGLR